MTTKRCTKRCTKCGETKPRSAFHRDGSGVVSHCKVCQARIYASYRRMQPDRDRASKATYKLVHPERVKASRDRYREIHREEIRAKGRAYSATQRARRPEVVRSRTAEWRKRNRSHIGAYQNEYSKRRRAADPGFKMLVALRNRLNAVLRRGGAIRVARTETLIGCSIAALRIHMEERFVPGMTWENHGGWHIDHIRPCASFDLTDPQQQRACFHWTNLQPLWGVENLRKGTRQSA